MKTAFSIFLVLITFCHEPFAQNALNFDGNDDMVQTNYSGVLGTTNRTFEAWVYVPSTAPSSNLSILDYGTNLVGSRNTFNISGSRSLSFISGGTNANIGSTAGDVPEDQWVHVAFVLNNGVGFLYVDGVQVGTGSLSTVNTPAGNENLKVGQRVSGGSIPFEGNIDEVRIWNIARTQAEIQADMNNELCSLDPSLQLYLRFNEGIANGTNSGISSTADDSGNGYSANISGLALTGTTSNFVAGPIITAGISFSSEVASECDSFTWTPNGTTYTSSGNYSTTLSAANINGCDSILTLDLTIFIANDLTTNVTECDSYTWSVNGQTYTSSTTVVESLVTGQGCSYNHTLNLNLGQSSADTTTLSECDSYTWSVNNQTYTSSGVYTELFSTQSGCDSTMTIDLTINTVDNTASDNGDLSMTAVTTNAAYQWLDCDNGFAIISGATSQTYTTTIDGNYAVEVTENGCTDTSACITIDYASLETFESFESVVLYPNPTKSTSTLKFGKEISGATISIRDASGRVISSRFIENTSAVELETPEETGVYFVQIAFESGPHKTFQLLKE